MRDSSRIRRIRICVSARDESRVIISEVTGVLRRPEGVSLIVQRLGKAGEVGIGGGGDGVAGGCGWLSDGWPVGGRYGNPRGTTSVTVMDRARGIACKCVGGGVASSSLGPTMARQRLKATGDRFGRGDTTDPQRKYERDGD